MMLQSLLARPAEAENEHTHRQLNGGRGRLAIVSCDLRPILGKRQLKRQQGCRPSCLAGLGLGGGELQESSEEALGKVCIEQRFRRERQRCQDVSHGRCCRQS
jgi:hypothetical protein